MQRKSVVMMALVFSALVAWCQPASAQAPDVPGLPPAARAAAASIDRREDSRARAISVARPAGRTRAGHARRQAGSGVYCHAVCARWRAAGGGQRYVLSARAALRGAHRRGQDKVRICAGQRAGGRAGVWDRDCLQGSDRTGDAPTSMRRLCLWDTAFMRPSTTGTTTRAWT